jgi:serine/threonine-protein kinase
LATGIADTAPLDRWIDSLFSAKILGDVPTRAGFAMMAAVTGMLHPSFRNLVIQEGDLRHAALLRDDRSERVTDVGALGTGVPFMTTELLEGVDLAKQFGRSGALPVEDAVDVTIQACAALAAVHAAGVLHCDVRPEKLFMTTRDGVPFVIVLTSIISYLGSPSDGPRAPAPLDPRTDVFSLGVTLCFLLTGKTLLSFTQLPPSPSGRLELLPRQRAPRDIGLPPDLVPTLEKACAQDRRHRYDSTTSFARALTPFSPPRSQEVLDRLCEGPPERRGARAEAGRHQSAGLGSRTTYDPPEMPSGHAPRRHSSRSGRHGSARCSSRIR